MHDPWFSLHQRVCTLGPPPPTSSPNPRALRPVQNIRSVGREGGCQILAVLVQCLRHQHNISVGLALPLIHLGLWTHPAVRQSRPELPFSYVVFLTCCVCSVCRSSIVISSNNNLVVILYEYNIMYITYTDPVFFFCDSFVQRWQRTSNTFSCKSAAIWKLP